jgi:hypothetical protein
MKQITLRLPTLLLAAAILLGQRGNAPDLWIGTWKLNAPKSRFEAGALPKTSTMTFQQASGGVTVINDWVNAEGVRSHIEFTAKYGGNVVSVKGLPGNSVRVSRVDAHTFDVVQVSSDFSITTRWVVSTDGKTLTSDQTLTLPAGAKLLNKSVFDRQRNPS